MARAYEAVITAAGGELFQEAFGRYMEGLRFEHNASCGRLGGAIRRS